MATADATRADPPGGDHRTPPGSRPGRWAPTSPVLSSTWLLRTAAFTSVAAGVTGVIVAPGLRGNAGEEVVVIADRVSATLSYLLVCALISLVLLGAVELLRTREIATAPRMALVAGGAAVLSLSLVGLRDRVPPLVSVLIIAAAAVTCLAGAYCAAQAPHTRAMAGVLGAFAFAAIARLAAWELAMRAGDTASLQMFGASRALATAGVFLEAAGQLTAITWLGARGRGIGQLACCAALVVAFALTWGVATGVHSDAAPWEAVVHTALADAPGVPSPNAFAGLATFLVPASLLLALVAATQKQQVAAIVAAMALALVSRGAFDAPLRGLCAVVAAQWAALAAVDERAMWRALLADRNQRIKEGDSEGGKAGSGPPPLSRSDST
jgi:hypothetical protein